jgi:hypothetical protein
MYVTKNKVSLHAEDRQRHFLSIPSAALSSFLAAGVAIPVGANVLLISVLCDTVVVDGSDSWSCEGSKAT